MNDAETLDSLRRWLREQEDMLRVRDAEIERLCQKLSDPCYAALWDETEKNALLTKEIERLRQRDETPRCPQCETLRLEAGAMRAEIERLRTDHELLSNDYKQLLIDIERLQKELTWCQENWPG